MSEEIERTGKIKVNQYPCCSSHCCVIHGCKYSHEDCPVGTGKIKQMYTCMDCDEVKDAQKIIDELWDKKITIEEWRKRRIAHLKETVYFIEKELGHDEEILEDLELMKTSSIESIQNAGWHT